MKTSIRIEKGLRLFKTSYRDEADQRHYSAAWWIEFRDHQRIIRRAPAFPDTPSSKELAQKLTRLVRWKANGELPDATLTAWLETMPADLRKLLARWNILDARGVAAGKPLDEHLSDWKAALLAKANTPRHVELVTSRAARVIRACGFKSYSEISASRVQRYLAGLREDQKQPDGAVKPGISAQTFNFYLAAGKQFCRWMVDDRRASESPVAGLKGLNVKTDRRHDRRALSPDELRWLLDVTEHGYSRIGPDGKPVIIVAAVERFGMSAKERALLYRFTAETGLRPGESASLTRASFALDAPAVTVEAAYSKHRRQDEQPIPAGLVPLLAEHLSGKMPVAKAFAMPGASLIVKMFRADLGDARRAWLAAHQTAQDASEGFLAYHDGSRYADFYSLRHTFISNLAAGGVHPKTAQTLARHSTITLTMDRYSHTYRGEAAAALAVLPDLSQPQSQVARATGTDDATATKMHEAKSDKHLARFLARFGHKHGDGRLQDRLTAEDETKVTDSQNGAETPGKTRYLTEKPASDKLVDEIGRGGRVAEGDGLLNRLSSKITNDTSKTYENDSENLSRFLALLPADLVDVVKAWPDLPGDVKRTICGVVKLSLAGKGAQR